MTIRIDDDNYQQITEEAETLGGFPPGAIPRESSVGELEGVPVFAEQIELLPESKWLDTTKETLASGRFIGQRVSLDANKDYQNSFPTCWAKSLAQAMTALMQAVGVNVQLQGESLIGVTGGRVQGYYLDKALLWLLRHGIASDEYVPLGEYNQRKWRAGWEQNAQQFMPLEGFDGGARDVWAETITGLNAGLGGYLAYNWARHALFADGLVIDGSKIGVHCVNTHGPGNDWTLYGKKAIPDEIYFLRAGTLPGTI